jgi:DNA-binding XRE family transcriptional regulator
MSEQKFIQESDLPALAKKFREAAGRNRAEAAKDLNVARQSIIYAEDRPEKSFFKLRLRIIEKYSPYKVHGPVYWLQKK